MKNLKITTKIAILLNLSLISLVGVTVYAFVTINRVKVTGNLYNKIEMNKDLTADILPPPFYLIEAFLNTYEIITFYKTTDLNQAIGKMKKLENEYYSRYDYWIENLPEGELKLTVTQNAYSSADRFFKTINREFFPALKKGDEVAATIVLNQLLIPTYLEHRRYIDRAVSIASKESLILKNETTNTIKLSRLLMISIPAIFIVFILIIGLAVRKNISSSMKKVLFSFAETSKGDLTTKVEGLHNDELGTIASYLNIMITNISKMIGGVLNTSNTLSSVGTDLNNNMNLTVDSINEITDSINHIDNQMTKQTSGVIGAQAAVEEIVNRIEALNVQIESQSASVVESSSAIEEMVANIGSVNSILNKNSVSVVALQKASELGREQMTEVAENINDISEESESLIEAANIIKNIAEQTNLLAMNAAIEAAHAGDAGKGFAVVADEIRKLAEDSSQQVKSISNILNKFKDSISHVADYSDTTLEQFEEIYRLSTVVSNQEDVIKSAMDEQNSGGSEILGAMREISDITEAVKNYSSEIMENSHGVLGEMSTLNTISTEVNEKIKMMSTNSSKITQGTRHTKELSIENQKSVDSLLVEISSFKIDN